jgi:hypothetical protein
MSLRELPINTVIRLLEAKQAALVSADLEVLNILKKQYPDLFCSEEIDYFKETLYLEYLIKSSPGYQHMQKELRKKKFSCIVNKEL